MIIKIAPKVVLDHVVHDIRRSISLKIKTRRFLQFHSAQLHQSLPGLGSELAVTV